MNCRVKGCGVALIVGENWYPSQEKHHNFICASCFREVKMRLRRIHGIKELIPAEKGKYGVPYKLPNGKVNLEYYRRKYAAKRLAQGKAPRPPNWGNMYGVPCLLPDGSVNPEYGLVRARVLGRKPQQPSKYGVPCILPTGEENPEWRKRQYVAQKSKWHMRNLRRRGLPPLKVVMGSWFEGAELHHMSKTVGIWIPRKLHHSIYHNLWTGHNMDIINRRALEWHINDAVALVPT